MSKPLTKAGRYEIAGELGRGSMGVVYKGFDPVIGRTVAVKTLLVEGLSPSEFQEYKARFQREARAAGVLSHPNIVTIYDFGQDNELLYLAMEYLEGKSLEKLIEEQHLLPLETVVAIFDQICDALDHAHANRIIHRDMKPANIMILPNGMVKVMDFGVARIASTGMTQAGQVLGTPNYMSPEQVKGYPVDGRSDIFSLGVMLYELVTGEKPFGGQNITTVIYKIINVNPIPPRELDPTIHPGLNYIIAKALAKSPDERYPTCRALAEDLKHYKTLEGARPPTATSVLTPPPAPQSPPAEPLNAIGSVVLSAPQAGTPGPGPQPPVSAGTPLPDLHPGPTAHTTKSHVPWVVTGLLFAAILSSGAYLYLRRSGGPDASPAKVLSPSPAEVPAAERPQVMTSGPPGASSTGRPAQTPAVPAQTPKTPVVLRPPLAPPASSIAETSHPSPAPEVGGLEVTSNIPGARISIDDHSEPDWLTPHTFAELPSGLHRVSVAKEGYSTVYENLVVTGGETKSFNAVLSAPSGEVTILTAPPGLEIEIDDKSYGKSPVEGVTLPVGQHTYTVKVPGMPPIKNPLVVGAGINRKRIDLTQTIAATLIGLVQVNTRPAGATVQADGTAVGEKTPTYFYLGQGRHSLTISLPGYQSISKEIEVSAKGTVRINETLTPQ
jgi:serine/threonine protein kinase